MTDRSLAVDNEIEIAGSTHQDMHPDPMGYDEELRRVVDTATMVKSVLPDVQVAAPSTCAWWFCKSISFEVCELGTHCACPPRLDEQHRLHGQCRTRLPGLPPVVPRPDAGCVDQGWQAPS